MQHLEFHSLNLNNLWEDLCTVGTVNDAVFSCIMLWVSCLCVKAWVPWHHAYVLWQKLLSAGLSTIMHDAVASCLKKRHHWPSSLYLCISSSHLSGHKVKTFEEFHLAAFSLRLKIQLFFSRSKVESQIRNFSDPSKAKARQMPQQLLSVRRTKQARPWPCQLRSSGVTSI